MRLADFMFIDRFENLLITGSPASVKATRFLLSATRPAY
jgi:hypothetical protein